MEEKKFPWLLRLLSANEISINILDTYVISKERVVAAFTISPDSKLTRLNLKSAGLETIYDSLTHLQTFRSPSSKKQIKHSFFYHKGKRTKISKKKISNFVTKKKSLPCATYIQSSTEDYSKFLTFLIEYNRESFRSSFIPPESHPTILEKAKELCKYLIVIIETHENRKILKMQIEFMIDSHQKLWLSYLDFCQTVKQQDLKLIKTLKPQPHSSEALEIINEFDSIRVKTAKSPNFFLSRDSLQRHPSFIRKLEAMDSFQEFIRIDSPMLQESELEEDQESFVGRHRKEEKFKISDDFIELLSKTKIVAEDPKKKDFISDEEYFSRYEVLAKELRPARQNFDLVRKRTTDFVIFKKSTSIMFPSGPVLENKVSLDLCRKGKDTDRRFKIFSPILTNRREHSLAPLSAFMENAPEIKRNNRNSLNINAGCGLISVRSADNRKTIW